MAKEIVETPLMKQYIEMKAQHPDAVLLFRVGDFYETFSEDAIVASEILGITLTRRANGAAQYVELAGFPHHALDTYLPKLVRAGKRVAICEQLEDPKLTKKLVKRGITELVTPGVSINDNILNHRENNFLGGVHFGKNNKVGVAFLDISTGEFLAAEGDYDYVDKLLGNFAPKEVLFERTKRKVFEEHFGNRFFTFELDDWVYTEDAAKDRLLRHFETKHLKGFGIHNMPCAIIAAGSLLHYLDITQHTQISHITSLSRIEEERYVRLDKFTVRSLELLAPMNEGGKSLLDVIDRTVTPMGARMLRRWIIFPLKDVKPIEDRLNGVEFFFRHPEAREVIDPQLDTIGDMERLISKVAVGRISPREMVQLKVALRIHRAYISAIITAAVPLNLSYEFHGSFHRHSAKRRRRVKGVAHTIDLRRARNGTRKFGTQVLHVDGLPHTERRPLIFHLHVGKFTGYIISHYCLFGNFLGSPVACRSGKACPGKGHRPQPAAVIAKIPLGRRSHPCSGGFAVKHENERVGAPVEQQ